MAVELVGGAFLSAALEVAFKRLASSDISSYFQSRKLNDSLLKKLHITLISLNQVLDDAEVRQYTKPNVKKWLHELKHAVYVADDLLDEIATDATRLKIKDDSQSATNKVRGLFTAFINPFEKQIESKVQQLLDDLEFLAKQKDVLGLKEGSAFASGSEVGVVGKVLNRLPTTSLVADESSIYGRDGDKEKIIEFLLDEDLSRNPLSVISIVGMGGLGKTTLAQLVYNNAMIKDHFQFKAWVCVSEEFDVVRITRTILSALGCFITGYEDLNLLHLKLKENLVGKKFLLVFDDIWNERQSDWEALLVPFFYGTSGSKIIVTTRSEKVALVMYSSRVYRMALLNEEDGWKLFAEYAFRNKDDSMGTNLESIGKKIVGRCKGLPLAIKTLGGLLHTKSSEKQWNEVLNSEIWQLPGVESDIMPALRLSYHYLPSNLKRCFAFCSIFPKDHKIEKDSIIQMWMAEDLLHNQGCKNVEEIGSQILDELESRSFLQKSTIHNRYIMHDLVNDLAKSISEEFCLRMEGGKVQNIHEKIRYLSYSASLDSSEILPEPFHVCKRLRCFVSLKRVPFPIKDGKDEGEILSKFKYLRILSLRSIETITKFGVGMNNSKHLRYLDLSDTRIVKLPDSAYELYNLQTLKLCGCAQFVELPLNLDGLLNLHYLDLSKTKISRLPDSLCKLPNLQTLKLQACLSLAELPRDLHKLINLAHLDISWTCIREMPNNMGRLKHLEILTGFYVGKHNGSNLKELGRLIYLRGSLEISKLENVNDPMDAREACMNNKKYLYKLDLKWSGNNEDSQNERCTLEVLQPHVNLKELTIRNYGGTRFADWFDAPHLPNLVSLVLRACKYCFCLPPLGQLPSLKSVHISKLEGIKKIGLEFYGNSNLSIIPFPSLENLFIAEMLEWEEWMHLEGECFPCLKEIVIRCCPRLRKSLPPHLPCLEKLEIEQCGDLELESFPTNDFSTPKLESIYLSELTHLKSLHEDMHTLLPYVRSLSLSRCPQLQSVPQKGLPLSLVQVSVRDCPKIFASHMNWGLHRLHFLQEFSIGENVETMESFPEEGLLPPNLKVFQFKGCSNLIKINSSGLLPLTSLQGLRIYNCPNLQCLPEESLSRSLSYLVIDGNCPFLTQRYQKKNGQDWHKISHIPWVCFS